MQSWSNTKPLEQAPIRFSFNYAQCQPTLLTCCNNWKQIFILGKLCALLDSESLRTDTTFLFALTPPSKIFSLLQSLNKYSACYDFLFSYFLVEIKFPKAISTVRIVWKWRKSANLAKRSICHHFREWCKHIYSNWLTYLLGSISYYLLIAKYI